MNLLLFDIDGTLMNTQGSGLRALSEAAVEQFGISLEEVPPFDLAGATDLGVVRSLFADLGRELSYEAAEDYKARYLRQLALRLAERPGRLLPGVVDLLSTLRETGGTAMSLLTGNYREGANLKLGAFSIQHYFAGGAYGDDAEDRNLLGPVALRRAADVWGRDFLQEQTIIIGDTPRDIACAAACGARCVAVATGAFTAEELRKHQPWQVVEDLTDLPQLIAWLTQC
jgi:phosphoglycolate phosphatase